MSFGFIIAAVIIAVALVFAIIAVLKSGRVKIHAVPAVLSLVIAALACAVCLYGYSAGTVYAEAEGDPQETVTRFFDALCAGDNDTAYTCLENYSSLGLENEPSSKSGELVYKALKDSYSYELTGAASVDKLTAQQTVSFTYLDLKAMEQDVEEETNDALKEIVRSRARKEVYDDNNNYLPAVTDEAYETAVKTVLRNAENYYNSAELILALDYVGEQWLIKADSALLSCIMGGAI